MKTAMSKPSEFSSLLHGRSSGNAFLAATTLTRDRLSLFLRDRRDWKWIWLALVALAFTRNYFVRELIVALFFFTIFYIFLTVLALFYVVTGCDPIRLAIATIRGTRLGHAPCGNTHSERSDPRNRSCRSTDPDREYSVRPS